MGQRGPIPNPEADLARPRKRKGGEHTHKEVTKGTRRGVQWPEPSEDWHEIALMLWNGAKNSGQADFYQESDVAILYSLCDDLTYYKNSGKRSGQMLATIYSAMSSLLVTEGDRRRVSIELQEPPSEESPAAVLAIASYKDALMKKEGAEDAPSS